MANVEPLPTVCAVESYRQGIQALVAHSRPTLFVTLAFNRPTSLEAARAKLESFQCRMDRVLAGRNWAERPDRRTTYIAVAEHVSSNLHLHAAFVVGLDQVARFDAKAAATWDALVPSGSVVVKLVDDAWGLGRYMAKEIAPATSERLLFSPNR